MQAFAGVADAGGEGLLHEGMDVLGVGVDGESAGGQVIRDGGQTAQNILAVLLLSLIHIYSRQPSPPHRRP